jgi:hypothetical protein
VIDRLALLGHGPVIVIKAVNFGQKRAVCFCIFIIQPPDNKYLAQQ